MTATTLEQTTVTTPMRLDLVIEPRITWSADEPLGSRSEALRSASNAINADFFPKLAGALARLSAQRADLEFGVPAIEFVPGEAAVPRMFARVEVEVDIYNLSNEIAHVLELPDLGAGAPDGGAARAEAMRSLDVHIERILLQSLVAATVRREDGNSAT